MDVSAIRLFASHKTPVAGERLGNLHHRVRARLGIMVDGDLGSNCLDGGLDC
jgi:hypothetical protein